MAEVTGSSPVAPTLALLQRGATSGWDRRKCRSLLLFASVWVLFCGSLLRQILARIAGRFLDPRRPIKVPPGSLETEAIKFHLLVETPPTAARRT